MSDISALTYKRGFLSKLNHNPRVKGFCCRAFDLAVAVPIAIPAIILSTFAIAALKYEKGGDIFFCDERMGQGNQAFTLFKLATMIDQNGQKIPSGPIADGIRRIGLDELPNLINIIKGDMSIVGPRPQQARDGEVAHCPITYRHKPGLTSETQLKSRNGDNNHKHRLNKEEAKLRDGMGAVEELAYMINVVMKTAKYTLSGGNKEQTSYRITP